jgi:hypothetical protein
MGQVLVNPVALLSAPNTCSQIFNHFFSAAAPDAAVIILVVVVVFCCCSTGQVLVKLSPPLSALKPAAKDAV